MRTNRRTRIARRMGMLALAALLALASLAERATAATFIVTSTADGGPGSLRQAILDANANAGLFDTIAFAIPGPGPHLIAPLSNLPAITDPVLVDGYSQPGASRNSADQGSNADIRVVLSGAKVPVDLSDPGNLVISTGLALKGFGSTVAGLAIHSFTVQVQLDGPGHVVEGCFLGTDASGSTDVGNLDGVGILLTAATDARIGGALPGQRNLIGALVLDGIAGDLVSHRAEILGNLIGVDAGGSGALPNAGYGIHVGGNDWRIGGPAPGEGNAIAFNGRDGIGVPQQVDAIRIEGNAIRDNAGLGINHFVNSTGLGGVTPNTADDTGSSPNFPVLDSAERVDGGLRITGILDHAGSGAIQQVVSVYASPACDASGHGEGARFLGSRVVAFHVPADEDIDFVLPVDVPGGQAVSATAMRPNGHTSEFSACVVVVDTIGIFDDGFEAGPAP